MLILSPLHHSWKSFEMNSGPLSHLMFFGLPFSEICLFQWLIHPSCQKRHHSFLGKRYFIAVIHYIQYPELPSALHHKGQRPYRAGGWSKESWPLPEGVSSNGPVSCSAYSCTHGKLPRGFIPFLNAWDIWRSSRNRLLIASSTSVSSRFSYNIVIQTVNLHQLARPTMLNSYSSIVICFFISDSRVFRSPSSISDYPMPSLRTSTSISSSLPQASSISWPGLQPCLCISASNYTRWLQLLRNPAPILRRILRFPDFSFVPPSKSYHFF